MSYDSALVLHAPCARVVTDNNIKRARIVFANSSLGKELISINNKRVELVDPIKFAESFAAAKRCVP